VVAEPLPTVVAADPATISCVKSPIIVSKALCAKESATAAFLACERLVAGQNKAAIDNPQSKMNVISLLPEGFTLLDLIK
jgi:hypothetical protein